MDERCQNCGRHLHGEYCSGCGQKCVTEADRRLGHLLRQAFQAVTDLDGRFWGSLRALFLQPGRLSRDYLDGRRRRWMPPISLFLLANVLYFVLPVGVTDFNLSLADQIRQPLYGPLARQLVEQRVEAWTRSQPDAASPETAAAGFDEVARQYAARSGEVGKALVVVHVPLLALGLMAFFRRRRAYFAEHLVLALHEFTFILLFFQCVLLPAGWLYLWLGGADAGGRAPSWVLVLAILVMLWHFALALRRTYDAGRWARVLLPLPLLLLMMIGSQMFYRPLQFFLTWAIS